MTIEQFDALFREILVLGESYHAVRAATSPHVVVTISSDATSNTATLVLDHGLVPEQVRKELEMGLGIVRAGAPDPFA